MSRDDEEATRTIDLLCGGTVTLTVCANLFELDPKDRAFVFGLIDRLAEYQGEVDAEAEEKGTPG